MKKIGILCAGDDELAPFLPHIGEHKITKRAMLDFHEGNIHGIAVVVLYSGVCKVNAAIAAQLLIDVFHVDAVINAGTAGGIDESVSLFDTVISTQVAYHDVAEDLLTEFHPWLPTNYFEADPDMLTLAERLQAGYTTLHFGKMMTGEQFISGSRRDEIKHNYAPLSVDMESAAIAHVCYVNAIPFLAIRTITDDAVHSGVETFSLNCQRAAAIAKDVTLELLAVLQPS